MICLLTMLRIAICTIDGFMFIALLHLLRLRFVLVPIFYYILPFGFKSNCFGAGHSRFCVHPLLNGCRKTFL